MCNLFRLKARPDHLRELLHYMEDHDYPPRSYVSPGSPIAIVRAEKEARHLALVRWGFVPSWAKEVAPGKPLTNARIETILEKASFKNAVRRRRCLIPADGYYEWSGELAHRTEKCDAVFGQSDAQDKTLERRSDSTRTPGALRRKQAYQVTRADGGPFAFAGLWEHWLGPDGSELETAAIITTEALPPMASVHPRMPVIVAPHLYRHWLANESVEAGKMIDAVLSHPDPTLIVEPVELVRQAPLPKPPPKEADQLTLF